MIELEKSILQGVKQVWFAYDKVGDISDIK